MNEFQGQAIPGDPGPFAATPASQPAADAAHRAPPPTPPVTTGLTGPYGTPNAPGYEIPPEVMQHLGRIDPDKAMKKAQRGSGAYRLINGIDRIGRTWFWIRIGLLLLVGLAGTIAAFAWFG
jgi:hypothetical protein